MATRRWNGLRIFQIVLWSITLVAAAYIVLPSVLPRPEPAGISVTPPGASLGPGVAMNSPFTLVDHNGARVSEANFAGKASVWFYGFTHCPDICPTALAEMTQLLADLGPEADKLSAVFVTVDPARDTPEILKAYLGYFDPRIVGLTGTEDEIALMTKARFVAYARLPQGESYAMQHPAGMFLVDASGNFAGMLDAEEGMDVKLAKLKRLVTADAA